MHAPSKRLTQALVPSLLVLAAAMLSGQQAALAEMNEMTEAGKASGSATGNAPAGGNRKVYKTVDRNGRVSFSDQPSVKAREVEIDLPNRADPIKRRAPRPATPQQKALYQQVYITMPKHEGLIANGLVPFTVSANVAPGLQPGHQLQLSINGSVHSTSSSGSFQVESIQRGQHSMQVAVLNAEGQVLKQSEPITVYARRPGGV